ncbi:archaeal proteasome endopeptidase complex subunit beta [Ignicoccus hospitalis]|uniref:Proteasome subunit beta 1 n=1 Tax=Ignicoccus hospitalis (strain KIN4/I / DSM 18386 / JCM 14125) TaxID=453591 RepID=PSB1_IGNH4|nr:archaeal proteasome endopeptidase complex subunit beta [Ignicoccus hospitalis]A8AA46.1 RecName: Full=Proteasome subunit beta 1; AltName: Full=20S proteasome beta subunit 1; AltName: Full=Proteasome core protein PsmB 1; Flags: Precursor [Ignicoccus hospitalis KIN4/I]ABU81798.1 Proteasome endopeptidase complex [Ignicoccus hospitalis KIN4/I]HIH90066.1 archaeal proteasome endopeptidase complex subunit beta [Desulfurococcaceae archaeon]
MSGPGATAVGIKVKDGVVLAAERRMSYGGFIMSKAARKVFKVGDRMGMACAGLYADMQAIARALENEIRYYEISNKRKMKVRSAARLLGLILYSNKLFPLMTETVFGGYDDEPRIFVLDPVGSVIEEKYSAVGTGAPLAMALLDKEYREDMSLEEAQNLAIESVKVASGRDSLSGDGIDVLVIPFGGKPSIRTVSLEA